VGKVFMREKKSPDIVTKERGGNVNGEEKRAEKNAG